jgi:MOSC domain-containing protein YiiM
MAGSVLSVNVGEPREIEWLGRTASTAIWKEPVDGRVQVSSLNLTGDRQADPRFHGGTDKAVYAYAEEDYDWWSEELGRRVATGTFGENLTLTGLDVTCAVIGDRWRVGSALLEVTGPRTPCWKLGARMESVEFPVYFAAAGRPGAYLRVLEEGELGAGDEVEVVHRPGHRLTIAAVAEIYHGDRARCEELLRAPEIGEEWRTWVRERQAGATASLPG